MYYLKHDGLRFRYGGQFIAERRRREGDCKLEGEKGVTLLTVKVARQNNLRRSEEKKRPKNEQKRVHIWVERKEDQPRAEDQLLKELNPRETWGENLNRTIDAERTTILITTNHQGRIDELVEIEVGSEIHEVFVRELGFKDSTVDPLVLTDRKLSPVGIPESDSSSESTSSQEQTPPSEKEGNYDDKDSLMDQEIGKEDGESPEHVVVKAKSQVGNKEVNGLGIEEKLPCGEDEKSSHSDHATAEGMKQILEVGKNSRTWAEVLSGPMPKSNSGLGMISEAVHQEYVDQPNIGASRPMENEKNQVLSLDSASDRELDSLNHFGSEEEAVREITLLEF
ncbi:hypothetical protein V6N12_050845 [Hibiscus sabdariffa]|uniref:Uncharacterized protein n=1 Tax=Hibiscus sabdariffa TaxID=183260 RepID=A0ABR2GDX1_9ROSI